MGREIRVPDRADSDEDRTFGFHRPLFAT